TRIHETEPDDPHATYPVETNTLGELPTEHHRQFGIEQGCISAQPDLVDERHFSVSDGEDVRIAVPAPVPAGDRSIQGRPWNAVQNREGWTQRPSSWVQREAFVYPEG